MSFIRSAYKALSLLNTLTVFSSGKPSRILKHLARKRAMKTSGGLARVLWPTKRKKRRR